MEKTKKMRSSRRQKRSDEHLGQLRKKIQWVDRPGEKGDGVKKRGNVSGKEDTKNQEKKKSANKLKGPPKNGKTKPQIQNPFLGRRPVWGEKTVGTPP